MKNFLKIAALIFLLTSCKQKFANPHIVIQTSMGDIEIELLSKQAPITANAFLSYIDSGYFRNSNFYRVLNDDNQPSNAPKTELIQGGIWKSNNKLASALKGIEHETTRQTGIQHLDGIISLARLAPGTASTEFFICVGDQHGLDYGGENNADGQGFAAFGKVIKGMNVVKKIYKANENNQYYDPPITIYNIVRE
jgi:peptidyl-prolyl cis-trans isomerase A (cyclophilin A)